MNRKTCVVEEPSILVNDTACSGNAGSGFRVISKISGTTSAQAKVTLAVVCLSIKGKYDIVTSEDDL